jgi:hypothetical protein
MMVNQAGVGCEMNGMHTQEMMLEDMLLLTLEVRLLYQHPAL